MTARTSTTTASLDWSRNRVNTAPKPCRICTRPALMTDAAGKPCHKTCGDVEAEARDERQAAEYYGRGGGR